MSHLSQASVLLWAILSTILLVFLIWHLWKFDKFKCLVWWGKGESGSFKRLMTYSYLLSVPLLMFYSVTLSALKYHRASFPVPHGVNLPAPAPFLWFHNSKHMVLALYLSLSISWALEMVTHLEELCFWLFLMATDAPSNWFRSNYFLFWVIGSIVALACMPTVVIASQGDELKTEAWVFLAGSIGSLSITLGSLPILWLFPGFITRLTRQGADDHVLHRLTKYSEMNNIRVIFRFLFVVPLLILAVDGIRPGHTHEVNQSTLATDLLAMLAGIGCVVSSMLTLLVFFPRSTAEELAFSQTSSPAPRPRRHGSSSYASNRKQTLPYVDFSLTDLEMSKTQRSSAYTDYGVELTPVHFDYSSARPLEMMNENLKRAGLSEFIDDDVEERRVKPYSLPLESVGYDEMQAVGARYSNGRLRYAHVDDRGRAIHPYIRDFKSPLDVHSNIDEESDRTLH